MTQGQDPYESSGGFTPYQPSDAPQGEPPAAPPPPPPVGSGGTPPPFVPYGSAQAGATGTPFVPYGSAVSGVALSPFVTSTSRRPGWVGWLIGIGVLITTCGGIFGGIAGLIGDIASDSGPDTQPAAPEIAVPSFDISDFVPPIDVPSQNTMTQVYANDLERDQCLVGLGFEPGSSNGLSQLALTDCAGPHNAQVLEVRVLSEQGAAEYDFTDQGQGNRSCFPLFSPAQKALFEGDKYTLLSFTETATPTAGDKVACLIVRTDGEPYRGFLPK